MKTIFFFVTLFLCLISNSNAKSDLVISATRYEQDRVKTSSHIKRLKLDNGKYSSVKTIGELLEKIPEVSLNSSGPGGTQTIHLRGSETGHVLVVLDGLPLNDPINTSKLFDFSQIGLVGIESIEILFGSHSVLYGSEAIGGVILISTKSPQRTGADYVLGAGNHSTNNQEGLILYKKEKFRGLFGMSRLKSEGFNSTTHTTNNPAEKDGFELINFVGRLGYENSRYSIDHISRVHLKNTDLDKGFGGERDDKNFMSDDQFIYQVLGIKLKTDSSWWNPEVKLGHSDQKRTNNDLPDDLGSTHDTQLYRSQTSDVLLTNKSYIQSNHILISGIHYQNEKGLFDLNLSGLPSILSEHSEDTVGVFLHHHWQVDSKKTLNAGFRLQKQQHLNEVASFKIGPSIEFAQNWRIFTLFSSGYKNPTLYQLHSQFGNSKLKTESALNYEIGFGHTSKKFDFTVNSHLTEIKNLIDLEGVFPNQMYTNKEKIQIAGVGMDGVWRAASFFKSGASLNYIHAENKRTNSELINRPTWKSNIFCEMELKKHLARLDFFGKGDRTGGSTTSPVQMPGFGLLEAEYRYQWLKDHYLALNIKNIFDKDYQDVEGFHTGGRMVKFTLNGSL